MINENYINHPNFGLLFRLCLVDEKRELFSTLYAQRLFFVVSAVNSARGFAFESVGRNEAKLIFEERLRSVRRQGSHTEYDRLQRTYKQTFQ